MLVRIQKWGNSLAFRIPIAFARQTGIETGAEVDLTLEDGRLVITPPRRGPYSLDDLVAGITRENRHGEVHTGAPQGQEVW
jgi:antitoxin MazE